MAAFIREVPSANSSRSGLLQEFVYLNGSTLKVGILTEHLPKGFQLDGHIVKPRIIPERRKPLSEALFQLRFFPDHIEATNLADYDGTYDSQKISHDYLQQLAFSSGLTVGLVKTTIPDFKGEKTEEFGLPVTYFDEGNDHWKQGLLFPYLQD